MRRGRNKPQLRPAQGLHRGLLEQANHDPVEVLAGKVQQFVNSGRELLDAWNTLNDLEHRTQRQRIISRIVDLQYPLPEPLDVVLSRLGAWSDDIQALIKAG